MEIISFISEKKNTQSPNNALKSQYFSINIYFHHLFLSLRQQNPNPKPNLPHLSLLPFSIVCFFILQFCSCFFLLSVGYGLWLQRERARVGFQLDPICRKDGNDAKMKMKMPPSYEGFGVSLKSSLSSLSFFVGLRVCPQWQNHSQKYTWYEPRFTSSY